MKTHRFEWLLGAVLAALFIAFWIWQTPGKLQKLSSADVDTYVHRLKGKLPGKPEEQAPFLARMRAFGLADDGRPVYMNVGGIPLAQHPYGFFFVVGPLLLLTAFLAYWGLGRRRD